MTDKKQADGTFSSADETRTPWWKKGSIRPWDMRLLIPSFIVGLAVYAWSMHQIQLHTPPEGHVFEELEPLTGVYRCCGPEGARSDATWVGSARISCASPGYYPVGVQSTSCRLKEQLNGKVVIVTRVWFPYNSGPQPLVKEITSDGVVYYKKTDSQLRRAWIISSKSGSRSNASGMLLLTYIVLLSLFELRAKLRGDKK